LSLYGETLALGDLYARGKPVMLIFTDPNCGPCTALLPEIGGWQQEYADKLTILPIGRGSPEKNLAKSEEHALNDVLLQNDWEVSEVYRVEGTPSAVLVDRTSRIASPMAGGAEAIRTLVARAVGLRHPTPVQQAVDVESRRHRGKVHGSNGHAKTTMSELLRIGEPTPSIRLPDLGGEMLALEDFRGKETLVLFWHPGCEYCQQMLHDLKTITRSSQISAPKILVVSAGTVETNRAMDLQLPVVLDQNFAAGRAFGASGTPAAVLIDANGKVASEVVLGAPAVLALARSQGVARGTNRWPTKGEK
jgi:peroxiredoxin